MKCPIYRGYSVKIRVYYEDTDAAGIVYYANYLKFCERARSELFFAKGFSPQSTKGYFVVRRVEADYLQSGFLGDLLEVKSTILDRRRASLLLKQEVCRGETLLFSMRVTLAFLSDGRPAKIPEELYSLLSAWEAEDGEGR